MDFDQYQRAAQATAISGDAFRVIYPALGLASEAGEVAGKIKKVIRDPARDFETAPKDALRDELGDVLWYVAVLASALGLSLDQIARQNPAEAHIAAGARPARGQRRPALSQAPDNDAEILMF